LEEGGVRGEDETTATSKRKGALRELGGLIYAGANIILRLERGGVKKMGG